MTDAAALLHRALSFRAEQRMEEAYETLLDAATLYPADPRIAFGLAQTAFETWRPAAHLFAVACRLMPDNPDLIRNHALALAAEGEGDAAQLMLETVLSANPGWADGHRALSAMRVTRGDGDGFDRSYTFATRAGLGNVALWMGWFQHHAVMKNWAEAKGVLALAFDEIGPHQSLEMAALYLDSERGTEADLSERFAKFDTLADPGLDMSHVRWLLRTGQPERAEAIATRHIGKASARMFWPYLALSWRLTGNLRAHWLEGQPTFARTFDLDFSPTEIEELASTLRRLHRFKAPYPEQSVRGGTQTDRQLFFNPDPVIQRAKGKLLEAVRRYLSELPAPDAGHPLLACARERVLFDGSWSVRLAGGGHHSSHTHVKGWVSSAFYVAVPGDIGPPPEGCLLLGAPPPELGLDLAPVSQIVPEPGRLALFPSTTWHATAPFAAGERLTIAFDIAPPLATES